MSATSQGYHEETQHEVRAELGNKTKESIMKHMEIRFLPFQEHILSTYENTSRWNVSETWDVSKMHVRQFSTAVASFQWIPFISQITNKINSAYPDFRTPQNIQDFGIQSDIFQILELTVPENHPRDWYIYLHEWLFLMAKYGKNYLHLAYFTIKNNHSCR